MKVAQLALSFVLFAFITTLPLAFSQAVVPVIDTSGNLVVAGVEYYVPAIGNDRGGGLILAKTGNSTCPVTVLHYPSAPITGVIISSPGTGHGIITTSTPLDIEVAEKPDCVESAKWNVFFDNDIGKAYVGIGGPEDHPGKQILSGTLHIQRFGSFYRFEFCVSGATTCLDIGNYDNGEGGDRLILTEQAQRLLVSFMRAPSPRNIWSVV